MTARNFFAFSLPFQSETDYDWFGIYYGFDVESKRLLEKLEGHSAVRAHWTFDEGVIFYWKTDGSNTYASMTAYVDWSESNGLLQKKNHAKKWL